LPRFLISDSLFFGESNNNFQKKDEKVFREERSNRKKQRKLRITEICDLGVSGGCGEAEVSL